MPPGSENSLRITGQADSSRHGSSGMGTCMPRPRKPKARSLPLIGRLTQPWAVTPSERAAAASFTAVPRSLASAASPTLAGAMLAAGLLAAPLVACGVLKICYDLALLGLFRRLRLPSDAK